MMFIWIIALGVIIYFFVGGNAITIVKKNNYDLLDERLAKGEISIDEYKELKKTLKNN